MPQRIEEFIKNNPIEQKEEILSGEICTRQKIHHHLAGWVVTPPTGEFLLTTPENNKKIKGTIKKTCNACMQILQSEEKEHAQRMKRKSRKVVCLYKDKLYKEFISS